MIFYTLFGPGQKLEIHDDKIVLSKTGLNRLLTRKLKYTVWDLQRLSKFQISVPKYLLWGKLEWSDFNGNHGEFSFSTNPQMMKKIELYLQKKVIKNHEQNKGQKAPVAQNKIAKTFTRLAA